MEDKRGGREGTVIENGGLSCVVHWDRSVVETVPKAGLRIIGYDPHCGSTKGVMRFV